MAKLNLKASAYRVARGKAEIAREERWQKAAKQATKETLGREEEQAGRKGYRRKRRPKPRRWRGHGIEYLRNAIFPIGFPGDESRGPT